MFKYIFHKIGLTVKPCWEICPLLLTIQNSYTFAVDKIWI